MDTPYTPVDPDIEYVLDRTAQSCEAIRRAKENNHRTTLLTESGALYYQMVQMMRDHGVPQTVTAAGEVEDGLQMLAHLIQKVIGADFRLTRAQQRIAALEAENAALRAQVEGRE